MALLYCGRLSDAEREGLEALRLDIRHVEANKLMGYLRAIQGRSAEAEQFYRAALQHAAQGREASAAFHLAWSLQAQGKVQIAQEMYQNLVKQYPRWSKSIREEAWRLATHPDARRRNGALALLRAQVVSQAAGDADSESLEAVAAAYAELGRFPEAVNSQQKALSLPSLKQDLREAMSHRLRLYQQSQAYREPLKL
jgi:tetratricopeptide (TPR) repeat protein